MIAIRCHVCNADPGGRWVQPPALVFIDEPPRAKAREPEHYHCREHLSAKREAEIQTRERELGFQIH
jgi:hypothetical protein